MGFTLQDKVFISLEQGILFYLLSLPMVYALTNRLVPNVRTAEGGAPTGAGLLLHATVFAAVTLVGMYVRREVVWVALASVLAMAVAGQYVPREVVWVALAVVVGLALAFGKVGKERVY